MVLQSAPESLTAMHGEGISIGVVAVPAFRRTIRAEGEYFVVVCLNNTPVVG